MAVAVVAPVVVAGAASLRRLRVSDGSGCEGSGCWLFNRRGADYIC